MKKLAALLIFSLCNLIVFAQEREELRPISFSIGLQPSIQAIQINEFQTAADINIVPILVSYAVNQRMEVRFNSVVNLQVRPELPSEISQLGVGCSVPFYFSKKNSEEGHRGFYVGPFVSATDHRILEYMALTGAVELGYAFLFSSVWSINVGAQAGSTIAMDPQGLNRLSRYTQGIFSFSYWF